MEKKTSVLSNAMLWFGAAVSIAEILTGTYFAPLGFNKAILAIILGHIIGGILMYCVGMIGARENKGAMDTVKIGFGEKGAVLFACLNVIQLIGWTSIMIYDGAIASNKVFKVGVPIWALVIGALILVWLFVGLTDLGKVNNAAVILLFILMIVLTKQIFFNNLTAKLVVDNAFTFGMAVELAVAMPLSWLPLISDYTKEAKEPKKATLASVVTYNIVSILMYVIGMGAALYTGGGDIASIMVKAGLGTLGLLIIIFSTVTTTFLDAYSSGVSSNSISKKLNIKWVAIIITIVGTILAMLFNMDNITSFLYFIGSVFAPMVAIQITDYYILKNNTLKDSFNIKNLLLWIVGFGIYRYIMTKDFIVGNTVVCMIVVIIISIIVNLILKSITGKKRE